MAQWKLNLLDSYSSTVSHSTGTSPAELIYGRRPRSHLDCMRPDLGREMFSYNRKLATIDERGATKFS